MELLNSYDIIMFQEHWLFKFEHKLITPLCGDHDIDYIAHSVDEIDPIPPVQPPRCFGGTAIIWKRNNGLKYIKIDFF